jgi:hypothetical protein
VTGCVEQDQDAPDRWELSAGVAQLVEHLICNQRVGGSNPFASSKFLRPEWPRDEAEHWGSGVG